MKLKFNHNFGHQEQGEFFHFDCELVDVAIEEVDAALEMGFLQTIRNNNLHWYQSRSTRVRTALTQYELFTDACLLQDPTPAQFTEMDHIYTSYCYYKKFKKYFEIGQRLSNDRFMAYYQDNSFVAWAKLRHYTPQAIETCLFVWDYSRPHTRLGTRSLEHEIAWSKQEGYEYVYLGPGYERSSLYKADMQGFEWWNGDEWTADRDQYVWLCKRDSKVKLTTDLYSL
jgi:arginyl-tRNA--protein-N-Asp/Glu arginylyltransferase